MGCGKLWKIKKLLIFFCRYTDIQQACRDLGKEVEKQCKTTAKRGDNMTVVAVKFGIPQTT